MIKLRAAKTVIISLTLILFSIYPSAAQTRETYASGIIVDAESGEPIPYASILFMGSQIGAMSNEEGYFEISNTQGFATLAAQLLSYKTTVVNIEPNKKNENLVIKMELDAFGLNTVVVKPSRKKSHYSRKNNPALELAKKVIEHKNDRRPVGKEHYKLHAYEKLIMSLDKFGVRVSLRFTF